MTTKKNVYLKQAPPQSPPYSRRNITQVAVATVRCASHGCGHVNGVDTLCVQRTVVSQSLLRTHTAFRAAVCGSNSATHSRTKTDTENSRRNGGKPAESRWDVPQGGRTTWPLLFWRVLTRLWSGFGRHAADRWKERSAINTMVWFLRKTRHQGGRSGVAKTPERETGECDTAAGMFTALRCGRALLSPAKLQRLVHFT